MSIHLFPDDQNVHSYDWPIGPWVAVIAVVKTRANADSCGDDELVEVAAGSTLGR